MPPLPDLLADALVPGEEGEITVGGPGGQDLDLAAVLERSERRRRCPSGSGRGNPRAASVPGLPGFRERPRTEFPVLSKCRASAAAISLFILRYSSNPRTNAGVPELFDEDRREADARTGREALVRQAFEDVEEAAGTSPRRPRRASPSRAASCRGRGRRGCDCGGRGRRTYRPCGSFSTMDRRFVPLPARPTDQTGQRQYP